MLAATEAAAACTAVEGADPGDRAAASGSLAGLLAERRRVRPGYFLDLMDCPDSNSIHSIGWLQLEVDGFGRGQGVAGLIGRG